MPIMKLTAIFFSSALLATASAFAESADPCATQRNTIEINECAAAKLAAKDKELNAAYDMLLKSLAPKHKEDTTDYAAIKEKLVEAQRDWIKFRDNDCDARYRLNAGGTIRGLVSLNCKIEHTELRTKQLRRWSQL
jgi:uncharacterized protein YecT (DUF1311 family)